MLFLYENGLGSYLLVTDFNGVQTALGTYSDNQTAITAFNNEIQNEKRTTILRWDGVTQTDYTTNPPTTSTP